MNCVICKRGETRPGLATVTLERGETTIVFKSVPAQVCSTCDEQYLDEALTTELLARAEEAVSNGVQVDVRQFVSA